MADRTYIIAEAGVNHNGSITMAKELIDVAVAAGADAVKFQTFNAEEVITATAPKTEYQIKTTGGKESQLAMVQKLELDEEAHRELIQHCSKHGIQFLSTPFDFDSVDLLVNVFDLPKIKIPSGEITNGPLLLKIAETGKPVILSTGMSSLGEVETALGVLAFGYLDAHIKPSLDAFGEAYCSTLGREALQNKITLLHCTTEYPAPFGEVNLRAMDTLQQAFHLPVGLSDHTEGIAISVAAVARGASIVEKHFTLDRTLPGPDHRASLEPHELKQMIKSIREVEEALGDGYKIPTPAEIKNRTMVRKSLVTKCKIEQDEQFSTTNLGIKRAGNGISPMHYWEYLSQKANKDYHADEVL